MYMCVAIFDIHKYRHDRDIYVSVCNAVAAPPADRSGWKVTKFIEEVTACFSLQLFCAL